MASFAHIPLNKTHWLAISFILTLSFSGCEASLSEIPPISEDNLSVQGADPDEIIRIETTSGGMVDVTGSGKMYLAGSSIPAISAENGDVIESPEGKTCSLNPLFGETGLTWSLECEETHNGLPDELPVQRPNQTFNASQTEKRGVVEISVKMDSLQLINNKESSGSNIEFWIYSSADQIVFPVYKKRYIYRDSSPYAFRIPEGRYFVRAFLDLDDSGLPEIGTDPQSRVTPLVVSAEEPARISLGLDDTSADSRLDSFNAYIVNSPEWHQPSGGKCGGKYLHLEAGGLLGNRADLSPLMAITPDMKTLELLDDGGCGSAFSNRQSSYDRLANDNVFTAGIDEGRGLRSGNYIFYYLNEFTGKITIRTDRVSNTNPLSSLTYLIRPDGSNPPAGPNPLIEWNAVSEAASYEVLLESTDHSIDNFSDPLRFVKGNFYMPPFELPDNMAYRVVILACDTDRTLTSDFDRISRGPDNFFIADYQRHNSITISGRLVSENDMAIPIMLYADGNTESGNWEASVYLPANSGSYAISVFRNNLQRGAILSAFNVDDSGFVFSGANQPYSIWRTFFQNSGDINIDLVWSRPLILLQPQNYAAGTGVYPLFSWEPYTFQMGITGSYLLRLRPLNPGLKPVYLGLSGASLDFRYLAALPYTNLHDFQQCLSDPSVQDKSFCVILPEKKLDSGLNADTRWEWSVVALSCDISGINDPYNRENLENYEKCMKQYFMSGENIQGESQTRTFVPY